MDMVDYTFNAIFSYEDDGISIDFPDLPGCISCGFSNDEALSMAKEALELYLHGMNEGQIPVARDKSEILIDNTRQKIFTISVNI